MPQNIRNALQAMSNTTASNISAPVDGIAWLLRKAGIPVPTNALMSSEWMRERGLTAPVEQGAGQVVGETLGLLSPAAVQAAAPALARGLLAVEANALAPAVVNRGGAAGQRGIFMGDLSKTWNKEAAERAAAMERAGADARAIWKETGTFRGADGKWRQEIDDSAATLLENSEARAFMAGPGPAEYPLGHVSNALYHPEMTASYPDVMDIKARLVKGQSGSYIPKTGFGEGFNLPSIGTKSTTLHELQHAIQQRQGFAQGGSPASFTPGKTTSPQALQELTEEAKRLYQQFLDAAPGARLSWYDASDETRREFSKRAEDSLYRRLAGEAEARAVQSRMNLSPEQRRALFPFDSYDVPVNSLIVR